MSFRKQEEMGVRALRKAKSMGSTRALLPGIAVLCFVTMYTLYFFGHQHWKCVTVGNEQYQMMERSLREENSTEPLTLDYNMGRLGNQMCTLAALYGISVLNKRRMATLPYNYEKLIPYFDIESPRTEMYAEDEHEPWKIGPYLRPRDRNISRSSNIIKGYPYPCSYTFFNHVRNDIRKMFRFREHIQSYVKQFLVEVKGEKEDATFVGVHVRRGDYITHTRGSWLHSFGGREVDADYFEKATQYFRDKYSNVIFLVVSDDRDWCRNNLIKFGMLILDDFPEPAYDMALLANCNHTIMTYGTFGFWGAYLAGGDVVYFDKFLKPRTLFTKYEFRFEKMYLPEWVGISTTVPDGFWDKVTLNYNYDMEKELAVI